MLYKISSKHAIFLEHFLKVEILLPGNCSQFGSNKHKNSYKFGHFLHRQKEANRQLQDMGYSTGQTTKCHQQINGIRVKRGENATH